MTIFVDLDGTLVRTDMLKVSFLSFVSRFPLQVFKIPFWLLKGRAYLKGRLASKISFDPSKLPYEKKLLDYLLSQKEMGRKIVLATASHKIIAKRISEYLGIFSYVIATDDSVNCKGRTKLDCIKEKNGTAPFIYIGDSRADLPLFEAAEKAILVNASEKVKTAAKKANQSIEIFI